MVTFDPYTVETTHGGCFSSDVLVAYSLSSEDEQP